MKEDEGEDGEGGGGGGAKDNDDQLPPIVSPTGAGEGKPIEGASSKYFVGSEVCSVVLHNTSKRD